MSTSFISKFITGFAVLSLGGASFSATPTSEIHVKLLSSNASKLSGTVNFKTLNDNEIEIKGEIKGLTPGEHGMHVHANGDCSDMTGGFKKSGGHFNPDSVNHGSLQSGHVGDLGNIVANEHGIAQFDIKTMKFNLTDKDKHSILGKALVVHAGQDDEKTNPAGNSGNRILCGVIK